MRTNVLLQVTQLGEATLADLALVGLDPRMDTRVLGQIGGVGKAFMALWAAIRLGVRLVNLLAVH